MPPTPPSARWAPDLATAAGRAQLAERVARAPAVALHQTRGDLEPGRPQLVLDIRGSAAGVVVALDHLLRPSATAGPVLRRRLAVAGFEDPRDPEVAETVRRWSVLARAHARDAAERRAAVRDARRTSDRLRRP